MIYRGLVITGTDTGVGKTEISVALIKAVREMGLRVGVIKPVETGCEKKGGELIPADGTRLMAAADVDEKIESVVPFRYEHPLAPAEAAKLAGRPFFLEPIFQTFDRMTAKYDLILVETAGGVMVPLTDHLFFTDLIRGLDLPVLIVARNQLGTINHTLLTIEALRSRGITLLGVILNQTSPTTDPSAATNAGNIADRGNLEVLASIPWLPEKEREEKMLDAIRAMARELAQRLEDEWRQSILRYLHSGPKP